MRFSNHDHERMENSPDYVYWVLHIRTALLRMYQGRDISQKGEPTPSALATSLTSDWAIALRKVVLAQDVSKTAVTKSWTASPIGLPTWPSSDRFTLIGDAVHSMTTNGSHGTNAAWQDAAALAEDLHSYWEKGWTVECICQYEHLIRSNADPLVKASYIQAREYMFAQSLEHELM